MFVVGVSADSRLRVEQRGGLADAALLPRRTGSAGDFGLVVLGEHGVEPGADQAAEWDLLLVGDRPQLVPNLRIDVDGDHHPGRTDLVGLDRPPGGVLPDNCIYVICGPLRPRCRGKAEQPRPFLGRYRVSLAGKGGMTALDNVKAFLGRDTRSAGVAATPLPGGRRTGAPRRRRSSSPA